MPMNTGLYRRLGLAALFGACSYTICRTPLLPLLARDLGASPAEVGFIVGASTIMGISLKLPAGAWSTCIWPARVSDRRGPRVHTDAAGLHRRRIARTCCWRCGSCTAARRASSVPVSAASVSDIAPADRARDVADDDLDAAGDRAGGRADDRRTSMLARGGYDAAFARSASVFARRRAAAVVAMAARQAAMARERSMAGIPRQVCATVDARSLDRTGPA